MLVMLIMRMILTTLLSWHDDNQILLEYICMFSLSCKLIYVNQCNLANNMLNSNLEVVARLMSPLLHLKPCMSSSWLSSHDSQSW
jgi:hypothetical protein